MRTHFVRTVGAVVAVAALAAFGLADAGARWHLVTGPDVWITEPAAVSSRPQVNPAQLALMVAEALSEVLTGDLR
jgi:hypothetical protein